MTTDSDVLARLWQVSQGTLTLDAFEDWFLTEAVDEQTPLRDQVAAILAESAGNVSDEVAVKDLAELLPLLRVESTATAVSTTTMVVGTSIVSAGSGSITEPDDQYLVPV